MERPRFSEELSTRRRQLGFSITQASRVLRLKEDVLIAFEEGDFESMPKSGYAQGMLSSYARYLGLDAARIVEMYVDELEEWRREGSRRPHTREQRHEREVRSPGVGQPYVASRGLLPTSGGIAGDMGSFATTRVRTRGGEPPADTNRSYLESGYEYLSESRSRPYTRRSPERKSYRDRDDQDSWRDIQTRDYGERGYEDDLRIGMDAQSYESASSRSGRRSSRGMSSRGNRQRVRTRSRNRNHPSRRRGKNTDMRQTIVIIVVAIVVISVILVNMISFIYNRNFNTPTSHPVSTASVSSESSSKSGSSTSASSSDEVSQDNTTKEKNGSSSSQESSSGSSASSSGTGSETHATSSTRQMTVVVTVEDGAVTWLEVECDGTSEIAEQVTGPWNQTYKVEESFSVQANDTSAVTVEQDGQQLQFEPMASGVGIIHVQGEKKPSATSNASEAAKKQKSTEKKEDEDTSSSSSSSGSSAKMGNDSSEDDDSGSHTYSSTSSREDDEDDDGYTY